MSAPGASTVASQVIGPSGGPAGASKVSTIARSCSVTLPVFATAKVYCTVSPALVTVVGEADLASVRVPATGTVTTAVDSAEVTALPSGPVPVAVAEFCTVPASTSSWVRT